jgi:DNA-binding GntR family transcriptional regulator
VPISPSEAEDVLEARLIIETHCARRAADAGPALVERLREAIAEQERGVAGFAWADRAFHTAIVESAGNHILDRQYDALRDRHQRIAAAALASDPTRIARFIDEHKEILGAIERRDGDAAASLMENHLQTAHELARRPR